MDVCLGTDFEFNFCFLYLKVTDRHKLRRWMRQEFLPNIYNQPWYNGLHEKDDMHIGNKMSILIGMPWMRQLRIRKSKLSVNNLNNI